MSLTHTSDSKTDPERLQLMAYVSTPEDETLIRDVVAKLLLKHTNINRGGVDSAVKALSKSRSPKVLIVDISNSELPLSDIRELSDVCEPGVIVLVIGQRNDVGLFRDLLSLGIADYITKPLSPDLIHKAINNALDIKHTENSKEKKGRVISFIGTRGGVGTSTLALNAARYLGLEKNRRTVIIDLDLQLGTIGLAMDLDVKHNLKEIIETPNRLDPLFLERMLEKIDNKLFVLNSEENLGDNINQNSKAIEMLITLLQEQFQFIIIDLPRQPSAIQKTVLNASHAIALVTNKTLPGMRDTVRFAAHITGENSGEHLLIVSNQATAEIPGWLPTDKFEKSIGKKINYSIDFDTNIAKSVSYGQTNDTESGTQAAIKSLTSELAGWGRDTTTQHHLSLLKRIIGIK